MFKLPSHLGYIFPVRSPTLALEGTDGGDHGQRPLASPAAPPTCSLPPVLAPLQPPGEQTRQTQQHQSAQLMQCSAHLPAVLDGPQGLTRHGVWPGLGVALITSVLLGLGWEPLILQPPLHPSREQLVPLSQRQDPGVLVLSPLGSKSCAFA